MPKTVVRENETLDDALRRFKRQVNKDATLQEATSLINTKLISAQEKAIQLLESITGWKNADSLIETCKNNIQEIEKEAELIKITKEKRNKKFKKFVKIVTPVVAIVIVFIIILNMVIIPKIKYDEAIKLIGEGEFLAAHDSLLSLGDYKDSIELADDIMVKSTVDKIKKSKVGDTFHFGKYEQDNDDSNIEVIHWQILAFEEDRALVVSKFALDCKSFNNYRAEADWGKCSLRSWLNDEFLNSAFSSKEKNVIEPVITSDQGIKDFLFLLSENEVELYLKDYERFCYPTRFAAASGAFEDELGRCGWWLRSSGNADYCASVINVDGSVRDIMTDASDCAVRPAMWIDLNF